jgi:hypothetical protein
MAVDAQQTTTGAAAPAGGVPSHALSQPGCVPAPETVRLYATD